MPEEKKPKIEKPAVVPTSAPASIKASTGKEAMAGMQRRPFFSRAFAAKDEFESKLLDLARVVHVRAGGKTLRFRAAVVSGDRKGKVGFGVATGLDVAQAIDKATRFSKKDLISISIVNDTISHQVQAKFGAAKILLRPQRKGRGLVAGGTVRVICTLAGIKNVSSKVLGRTGNKINNARATIEALEKLKSNPK